MGKEETTRFWNLVARRKPLDALEAAVDFILRALRLAPTVTPTDFLKPGALNRAMWAVAKINGWMPVSRKTIQGYASWLGCWRSVQAGLQIAVDAELWQEVHTTKLYSAHTRAQSKFLAITAHEIGHILMRPEGERIEYVQDMASWAGGLAPPESLLAEADAWLFAGFLRAFVFADIGSAGRPDSVHMYA